MFNCRSDATCTLTASLVGTEVPREGRQGKSRGTEYVPLAFQNELPNQTHKGDGAASRPAGEQREKKLIEK